MTSYTIDEINSINRFEYRTLPQESRYDILRHISNLPKTNKPSVPKYLFDKFATVYTARKDIHLRPIDSGVLNLRQNLDSQVNRANESHQTVIEIRDIISKNSVSTLDVSKTRLQNLDFKLEPDQITKVAETLYTYILDLDSMIELNLKLLDVIPKDVVDALISLTMSRYERPQDFQSQEKNTRWTRLNFKFIAYLFKLGYIDLSQFRDRFLHHYLESFKNGHYLEMVLDAITIVGRPILTVHSTIIEDLDPLCSYKEFDQRLRYRVLNTLELIDSSDEN